MYQVHPVKTSNLLQVTGKNYNILLYKVHPLKTTDLLKVTDKPLVCWSGVLKRNKRRKGVKKGVLNLPLCNHWANWNQTCRNVVGWSSKKFFLIISIQKKTSGTKVSIRVLSVFVYGAFIFQPSWVVGLLCSL